MEHHRDALLGTCLPHLHWHSLHWRYPFGPFLSAGAQLSSLSLSRTLSLCYCGRPFTRRKPNTKGKYQPIHKKKGCKIYKSFARVHCLNTHSHTHTLNTLIAKRGSNDFSSSISIFVCLFVCLFPFYFQNSFSILRQI